MPPSHLAERLVYRRGDDWLPLPPWASFLIRLGGQVAEIDTSAQSLIGIVLPARDYAALLVASGAVVQRSSPISPADANARYWEWVASLAPGTPVCVVLRDGRLVHGVIDDHTIEGGWGSQATPGTWVKTTKDGRRWISASDTNRIQPSDKKAPSFERNPQRRAIKHAADFVAVLVPDQDPSLYASTPEPGCIVCGTVSMLVTELTVNEFGAAVRAKDVEPGTLQDILRVRRFAGHEEAFRTELVPAASSDPSASNYLVHTAIFDGGLSFVKHQHRWRQACQVAVLSETDAHLAEAVDVLQEAASAPGVQELGLPIFESTPKGCEVVSFHRPGS